jgi:DNA-binding NarL/FixJ family response regulator
MIRVGLCDDDALIREGLRLIIDQETDLTVVGQAGNGAEAVDLVSATPIDVLLMDIRMPVMDGLEATRRIVAREDAPRVIILTTFELDEYVFAALLAGASGFLLKRAPPEQLLEAIKVVASGEALLAPSVTRRLIEAFTKKPPTRADPGRSELLASLTPRELEVLRGIGRGLSNQELAAELFIADNTVKTHVKRVFTKIGARDRAQAVVIAYESGLV